MESITCNTILKNGSFSARVKKYTFNKNKFKFNKKYLDHVFSVLIQEKYFLLYEFFIQCFSDERIWSSICTSKSECHFQ